VADDDLGPAGPDDDPGLFGPDDDLGLFGPDSVSWRLHREPILLLAGLRALYLQALHPRAVAGVVQNSAYEKDPWGRLERTGTYVATTVFGTTARARAAGRRVRAIHARLRATDLRTGEVFRLDEPALLRWVHITEVESFLTVGVRAGVQLSADEIDQYYDEQRRAAELVGLDPQTVPGTAAAVAEYYRLVRPELTLTSEGIAAARFLTSPPMPYGLWLTPLRLAYLSGAALAVGLLPPWARRLYGLAGLPTTDLSSSLSVRALRSTFALLPRRLSPGPIFRAAVDRAAARAASAGTGRTATAT
jgi:uncharacterized protein (DUF2236 family)